MKTGLMMIVLAGMAPVAMADLIDARYLQVAGGNSAAKLRVGGQTFYAGHMVHRYEGGLRAGEQFATFCIELDEAASSTRAMYQIVDLAQAPMPGTPYGQAIADQINAVVANAASLGWIDRRLQADASQQDYLLKMGAIQAAIWEALGGDIRLNASQTTAGVAQYYNTLMNEQTFNPDARIGGLRAMVNAGQQDMLYVVPLPPAAFAGLGMLGLGFGVRTLRRR